MKKNYLYLVFNNSEKKLFKVGYTSANNPLDRLRKYLSHSPETIIDLQNIFEVPEKIFEKLVYLELIKIYEKVKTKGQKEWLINDLSNPIDRFKIKEIINKLKSRGLYEKSI